MQEPKAGGRRICGSSRIFVTKGGILEGFQIVIVFILSLLDYSDGCGGNECTMTEIMTISLISSILIIINIDIINIDHYQY